MAELQEQVEEIVQPLAPHAWRIRCPLCGAADWTHSGTEPQRFVFRCRACKEDFQVDVR